MTLLIYDSFLTLGEEVQWMWPRKKSALTSVLLAVRAVSALIIVTNGWERMGADRYLTDRFCQVIIASTCIGAITAGAVCNWIYLMRTKILFGNRQKLNVFLNIYYILAYLATFGLVLQTIIESQGQTFYSANCGACGIARRPKGMGFLPLGPMSLELLVFLLTLYMIYKQREATKTGPNIIVIICRDSILFYMVILGLRVYVFLSWMVLPLSTTIIGIFLLWSVMLVGANRMQLNLIRAASIPQLDLEYCWSSSQPIGVVSRGID